MSVTGLNIYIDDLNTRFENQLFTDIENISRKFYGLARLDVLTGIPYMKESSGEYTDVLFNDKYDFVSFYLESGDRKNNGPAFTVKVDLIVIARRTIFTDKDDEELLADFYEIMKPTSFEIKGSARDINALKGIKYPDITPDTMEPYFAFKISTELTGVLTRTTRDLSIPKNP